MEKLNFSYDFLTKGGAFHNFTKNKKPKRKIFSNKDAEVDHFHHLPEM